MHEGQRKKLRFSGIYLVLALLGMVLFQSYWRAQERPRRVPYSEFLTYVKQSRIYQAEIRETDILAVVKAKARRSAQASTAAKHAPSGQGKPAGTNGHPKEAAPAMQAAAKSQREQIITTRVPGARTNELVDLLTQHGVTFSGHIDQTPWWETFAGWILPIMILVGLYSLSLRRVGRGMGPMSLGKARVKIHDQMQSNPVTFDDVAGVDEAVDELKEVVDFLENPDKYQALGARIPKGVLLVGPPGTGKTLLAKAVAGEAGVPFFSMSGSEFVEMFVGMGAARVRDLFEQAKTRAPCIVFIDELDAIGKSRGGVAAMATHDEREQTLNQLLVEMDGFQTGGRVVIMAATNRPEVLDQALVRAGRFDRQVLVDRPDLEGRTAILHIHARKVDLADNLDLRVIGQRTPGMVGADLANIVNEAALAAARRGAQAINQQDFEEAIDRIQLGLKKQGRVMSEEEKRRVAFHEAGHALVALSVQHADPVHRVTIIPRSIGALGVTLQLPTEDRYLMTREELIDRLCVMLGGRAAEQVVCGNLSTGAQNDLERVTETARHMVCRFGMSEKLGAQTFGRASTGRFLSMPFAAGEERNYSEETARVIDEEVGALIDEQYRRAIDILTQRRDELDGITQGLLERETLDAQQLEAITGPQAPRSSTCPSPKHEPLARREGAGVA